MSGKIGGTDRALDASYNQTKTVIVKKCDVNSKITTGKLVWTLKIDLAAFVIQQRIAAETIMISGQWAALHNVANNPVVPPMFTEQ